jgi:hypothetical protein
MEVRRNYSINKEVALRRGEEREEDATYTSAAVGKSNI